MVWSTAIDNKEKRIDSPCVPPRQLEAANAKTGLEHASLLNVHSATSTMRLTGIICTIGPASTDVEVLEKLMEQGMNIARLNFATGTQETHAIELENIRTAAANFSKRTGLTFPIAIAVEIKGPEIRTGFIEGGISAEVELIKGDTIKLTPDKAYFEKGTASVIYVDYENIQKVAQVGIKIYIDDGLISLICTGIQGSVLTCVVEIGGHLGSCKCVNLPGVDVDLPVISEKDKEDLLWAVEQRVDIIFASFIRNAISVSEIREILGTEGEKIVVVSKIESQQGVQNLDEIIKASDGIMVGRGNLALELPVEKLFLAQKCIMAKCNKAGRPVICATQLMYSMVRRPRPTRAESLDVANAILDGADCVMLSDETSRGDFLSECITTMTNICKEAEAAVWNRQLFIELADKVIPPLTQAHAIAIAATEVAAKCLASAIIVVTASGRSAHLISRYRPICPIVAVTRNPMVAKQAHLYRGILPLIYELEKLKEWSKDMEARLSFGISFGKWKGFIKAGDPIVAINGSRKGSGYTDTLRILYVLKPPAEGEPCGCDFVEVGKEVDGGNEE